ncbi:MAG TPA: HEAT repeat domain-containing protein [Rhizomicrobium sp.]|nr:HEAT repeat domain-containing protein [Rhizomicrobium sp.]
MDENRTRKLVQALDTPTSADMDAAWEPIRAIGAPLIPFLAEFLPKAKNWLCRASLLTYLGPYSRESDVAFAAGLAALNDKSKAVRYSACELCAYSLRKEAIPPLQVLLGHSDPLTSSAAAAAIDAITHRNHHYFRDRDHSGVVRWDYVSPGLT